MPEYLAPGVSVEEVPFRSSSIEGCGTCTAGPYGYSARESRVRTRNGNTSTSGACWTTSNIPSTCACSGLSSNPITNPPGSGVRALIEDFLVSQWKNGALMGATPEQAFYVHCDRGDLDASRHRPRRPDLPGRYRAGQTVGIRHFQNRAEHGGHPRVAAGLLFLIAEIPFTLLLWQPNTWIQGTRTRESQVMVSGYRG